MANLTAAQKAFFDREWGGFDKYVAGQRARFLNAANSTPSDIVTMQKIKNEADRLGYSLPSVITNGGTQGVGGGNSGLIVGAENLPFIPSTGSSGSPPAGSSGIINPDAAGSTGASIGDGIGAALSKISLNNFLVIIGVVFGFLILRKAVRAVK
jgi:hypothetical protein